jgi:putative ABC transport system permease protein
MLVFSGFDSSFHETINQESPMPYSLAILWRDRARYLPAVLAVTFSAVLIAVQCGLVLGLLICTSVPIDHARADLWVITSDAASLPQTYPIPDLWRARVAREPEIARTETYLLGAGSWHKPNEGSAELCFLIGSRLDRDSLGVIQDMPPDMRARLTEPGTVVVDEWDLETLGLMKGVGEHAEINGQRVRVVGTVRGFRGHNFIYVFCSLQTARMLMPLFEEQPNLTMCVLARCKDPGDAPAVVDRLRRRYPDMGVYTSAELARRVQLYWLFRSSGGTVMLCTIALALLVGLVVTSQTLYAAVLASLKEYAVLDALGIPRWRLAALTLAKSFWIGALGMVLALPVIYALGAAALLIRTRLLLPVELMLITAGLTLGMALVSGISALRPLRRVEPATLLR